MNANETATQLVFSPQYDLTKDLVITLDYNTSSTGILDGIGWGGILIGLYDNTTSNTLQGTVSTRGLGFAKDIGNGSTTGLTNGIIGIGLDLDGVFYTNSLGLSTQPLTATQYVFNLPYVASLDGNRVVVVGPSLSSFPQLYATSDVSTINFGNLFADNINLKTDTLKRIRARFTDFGRRLKVDFYNFSSDKFTSLVDTTWYCTNTACGVFINYYTQRNNEISITIDNININGMFTSNYISLSTTSPIIN